MSKLFSPEPTQRTFRDKQVWEVDLRAWPNQAKRLGVPLRTRKCVFRSIPIARFGLSRSRISVDADHWFRTIAIAHFGADREDLRAGIHR